MKNHVVKLLIGLCFVAVMGITANAQNRPTVAPTLENAKRALDAQNYTECIGILDQCRAAGNWTSEHALLYDDATYLRDVDQLISSTNNLQNVSTATQAQVCEKFLQRNGDDEQYADKVRALLVDYYVKIGNQTKGLNYMTEEEWQSRRAAYVKQGKSTTPAKTKSKIPVQFGLGFGYSGYFSELTGVEIPINLRIGKFNSNFNVMLGAEFHSYSTGYLSDSLQYIDLNTGATEYTTLYGSNALKVYQLSFSVGGRLNLGSEHDAVVFFLQGDGIANYNFNGRMEIPKNNATDKLTFKVNEGLRPLTFGVHGSVGLTMEHMDLWVGVRCDFASPFQEDFFDKEYIFNVSNTSDAVFYDYGSGDKLAEVQSSGNTSQWRAQNLLHSSTRIEEVVASKWMLTVGVRIFL